MSFWDKVKNLKQQVDNVEAAVYSDKFSLMEMYERNAKLEREIKQRTKELDTANAQMLSLQHILSMMNSSKPLSSVLSAVVKSLQGELGYLSSCIAQKIDDENGGYYQLSAWCGEHLEMDFPKIIGQEPNLVHFLSPVMDNIIFSDGIYYSSNVSELYSDTLSNISKDKIEELVKKSGIKSYIFIPLKYKDVDFGSLVVFSSREETTENELNFLKLFAKQIEVALTIADLFQAVREQAVTDGMTGLFNRRYFEEFIKKEAIRSERQHQKFTVIGLDLDHLKQINDEYGHSYGDLAINTIANILKKSCRSIDIAARMGGEEFNIILPGVDANGGRIAAERIRKAIESAPIENVGKITASLGVGTFSEHSDDIDELLELVDQAMYTSKKNGRNQVTVAQVVGNTYWQTVAADTFIDILKKHRIPIDNSISDVLNQKLSTLNINNNILYQVSDMLISTYQPEHEDGTTKQKIILATLLAKRFELSKDDVDKLKIAVLLYDIGNTMLPKELLNKSTPLNDDEIQSIKQHPLIAARQILEPISNVVDVIPIIEKHHENWNGTGYPNKLSGEDIPIESQIILIIDSYFALLEQRPYRDAKTSEEAIEIIKNDINKKWSKKLADEFVQIIQEGNN